jgi:hypothetical protein
MPTDATGTPTDLGIPTYNTNVDAPSGLGFNAAMEAIDTLIAGKMTLPASPASGDVPVWDGDSWEKSSGATKIAVAGIAPGSNGQVLTTTGGATAWGSGTSAFKGFSAYRSAALSMATGINKVTFDAEDFDSDGWFDPTTNPGRFTPLTAGKYLLSASWRINGAFNAVQVYLAVYKNGSLLHVLDWANNAVDERTFGGAVIVDADGVDDYFEVFLSNGDSAVNTQTGSGNGTFFHGTFLGA